MSLIDRLIPAADRLRKIPDRLGVCKYTVHIVRASYNGGNAFSGEEPTQTVVMQLTCGGTARVKVKHRSQQDLYRGIPPECELIVGPITPAYPGGGFSWETLEQMEAEKGSEIYYEVSGPDFPEGVRFLKVGFACDRATAYFIYLKRAST